MSRMFTRTYFDLVLADVNSVSFVRNGASATGWSIVANAGVRADDGQGYTATRTQDATAGQKTQIESFITNHVLDALNIQEALTA